MTTEQNSSTLSANFFTVPELVTAASVSKPTVYNWIKKGWLKTYKIGGQLRVSPEAWEDFLNREN